LNYRMLVRNSGEIAGESPYFNIEGTIQSARGTVQYSGIHFQSFNFLSTARMATVNTYVKVCEFGAIRIHGIIVTHMSDSVQPAKELLPITAGRSMSARDSSLLGN